MKFKKVTHVIFDLDGTLIDTERIYTISTEKICQKYGKTFTWEIKQQQMGMPGKDAAELIVKILNLPITAEEYMAEATALHQTLMPECTILPGVEKLLNHLHEQGIPTAVATSSAAESVKIKTTHHQKLMSLFHHIVCAGSDPEVKCGKPSPDIFLVAASRFDEKPDPEMKLKVHQQQRPSDLQERGEEIDLQNHFGPDVSFEEMKYAENIEKLNQLHCLVFEDAPLGLRAGVAAGMQVVFIPDERVGDEVKKNATITLKSMEEFRPEWFGLPPY